MQTPLHKLLEALAELKAFVFSARGLVFATSRSVTIVEFHYDFHGQKNSQ